MKASGGSTITQASAANALSVTQTGNTGTDASVNGAVYINNTANTGQALSVYTNQGSAASAPLVEIRNGNTAFDNPLIATRSTGTAAKDLSLGIDGGVRDMMDIGAGGGIINQNAAVLRLRSAFSGKSFRFRNSGNTTDTVIIEYDTGNVTLGEDRSSSGPRRRLPIPSRSTTTSSG